jgi:hypothetical protein
MGLSFVSTYSPASLSALTTSTRAWNRFIPYITCKNLVNAKERGIAKQTLNRGPALALNVPSSFKIFKNSNLCLTPTS